MNLPGEAHDLRKILVNKKIVQQENSVWRKDKKDQRVALLKETVT